MASREYPAGARWRSNSSKSRAPEPSTSTALKMRSNPVAAAAEVVENAVNSLALSSILLSLTSLEASDSDGVMLRFSFSSSPEVVAADAVVVNGE